MGRPKKENTESVENTVTEKNDDKLNELMAKMEEMTNMLASVTKENNELKEQIKNKTVVNEDKPLPKRVKVMSLLPNPMNLVTSTGRIKYFEKLGDVVTISLDEIEDILSNPKFREKAENGYFAILNDAVVEDQGLDMFAGQTPTKEELDSIEKLSGSDVVDNFCKLDKNRQKIMGTKIAQNIAGGMNFDRNITAEINRKTDVDIEKYASIIEKYSRIK